MTERRNEKDAMGEEERGRSPSGATLIAIEPQAGPLPPNGRWSTRRKAEVVIRMLSNESIDSLSRELAVEPYSLEKWRDKALAGMEVGLKEHGGDPLTSELNRAKKTIGELTIENELLRRRCEARESLRKRRSLKGASPPRHRPVKCTVSSGHAPPGAPHDPPSTISITASPG